jgi:putative peptide zinc metalloprotease protein
MSIGGLLWSLYKLITMPRSEPLSRWKTTATLGTLAAGIAAAMFIPFPWVITAPLHVEPVDVEHVYAVVPGVLKTIHHQPGDSVAAGELLAEFHNPELEERVLELEWQARAETVAIESLRQLDRPQEVALAEQKLASIESQLAEARQVHAQTQIRAPIAGTIVAPPWRSPPPLEQQREQLPQWAGSPLEPRNLGSHLDERTHLCSIAPTTAFRAVLMIDQADWQDMSDGLPVRMKLENLPDRRLSSVIETVSRRSQEYCPPNLSNKHGGPLPTVSDSQGRERLTSAAFPAYVPLDVDPRLVRTGMRGDARVIVSRRSVWDWTWRWLRTTFKFRL